jgi:AraC family transcriptional regulator
MASLWHGKFHKLAPFPNLLSSSEESPWAGFKLQRYRVSGREALQTLSFPEATMTVITKGLADIRIQNGVSQHHLKTGAGRVSIFSRGTTVDVLSWLGTLEITYVEIARSLAHRYAGSERNTSDVDVATILAVPEPSICALVDTMQLEIDAGCPAGRLYGEQLSMALGAYLAGRYAQPSTKPEYPKPELPQAKLRDVRDHIRANLANDLSVFELAKIARLSPFHFSRLFKNSVGLTPCQYVIRERIQEGARMLRTGQDTIAEIALAVGFSSQSHFSDVFRKITGSTPKRERSKAQGSPNNPVSDIDPPRIDRERDLMA